ncbi:MAG: pirin family protein [Acidobacteriota bacterium]|nr:pirin family protein [Acidobacteriota bacterium]
MITVRKANERGHANHGWLDSHHTFSFASYYDPAHMGFRKLRVINEDRVEAGRGFGKHPHRDMEIISYVIEGALEHGDSMGNNSTITPGEIQRMSAGTGVVHSEYNHSKEDEVHFLQIWIETERNGIPPSYEQKRFDDRIEPNELNLIAGREGGEGAITVHQDVNLYVAKMDADATTSYHVPQGRYAWIQMVRGNLTVNGVALGEGDGAAVSDVDNLEFSAGSDNEFLLFDLA